MRRPQIVITALARIEQAINAVERAFGSIGRAGSRAAREVNRDWQLMVRMMIADLGHLQMAAQRTFALLAAEGRILSRTLGRVFSGLGLLPGMGMMFGLGGMGTIGAAGIASVVGGFTLLATESLRFKENTEGSLEAMMKSKEEAQRMFEVLQHWADITPFEMQETVEAGKQLLAYSLAGKENMVGMLNLVGDAAFAMKVPMTQVIHALEFARSGMAHIRMLAPLGVSREDLQQRGVHFETTGQVAETSRGRVYAALEDTLRQRFGGTMERLANSFEARWTTAISNIRRLAMALGENMFASFGRGLASVNASLETLLKSERFRPLLLALQIPFNMLGQALENLAARAGPFLEWLREVVTYDRVKEFMLTLAANVEALWDRLVKFAQANIDFFASMDLSGKNVGDFWDKLNRGVTSFIGSIIGAARWVETFFKISREFIRDSIDMWSDLAHDISTFFNRAMGDVVLAIATIQVAIKTAVRGTGIAIIEVLQMLNSLVPQMITRIGADIEKLTGYKGIRQWGEERQREARQLGEPERESLIQRNWKDEDALNRVRIRYKADFEARKAEDYQEIVRRATREQAKDKEDPDRYLPAGMRLGRAFAEGVEGYAKEIAARKGRLAPGLFPMDEGVPPMPLLYGPKFPINPTPPTNLPGMVPGNINTINAYFEDVKALEAKAKSYEAAFDLGIVTAAEYQRAQLDLIEAHRRQAAQLDENTEEGQKALQAWMQDMDHYRKRIKAATDEMIRGIGKRFDILSEYIGLFPKGKQHGMNEEFLKPLLGQQRDALAKAALGEEDPSRQLDLVKSLVDTAKRYGEMDKGSDPFRGRFGGAKNGALDFLLGQGPQREQLRKLIEQGPAVPIDPMQRTADNTGMMVQILTQMQQEGARMLAAQGIHPQDMMNLFRQLVRTVVAQDYEQATGMAARVNR